MRSPSRRTSTPIKGVSRICRYAFEYAQKHDYPKVTMADKHGSLIHAHGLWQRVFLGGFQRNFPTWRGSITSSTRLCQDLLYKPEDFRRHRHQQHVR